MKRHERPATCYRLAKAQSQILLGQCFSLEPKKALESNVVDFYVYAKRDFDPLAMEKALNCLLARNDALRLHLVWRWGVRQQINPETYYKPVWMQAANREEFDAIGRKKPMISIWAPSLVRAAIVQCADGGGGMFVWCHHLCCDGYSYELIFHQINVYYQAYRQGQEPAEMPQYSITRFLDYERQYLKSPQYKADWRWWFRQYTQQPRFSFPVGRIPWRCVLKTESMVWQEEDYRLLQTLCAQTGCTYVPVLMAIGALVVYSLTGKENFGLYALTHGRMTLPLKRTVGCMFNTFPVFYDLNPDQPASAFLQESYMTYLEALSHARFPVGDQILMAAKETYVKRFGYNYFWCVFSAMEFLEQGHQSDELEMDALESDNILGMFYCALLHEPSRQCMRIDLTYQCRCFSKEQIACVFDTALQLVRRIAVKPERTVRQLGEAIGYLGPSAPLGSDQRMSL